MSIDRKVLTAHCGNDIFAELRMLMRPSMKSPRLFQYTYDPFYTYHHCQCSVRAYLVLLGEYDWYQLIGDIAKAA